MQEDDDSTHVMVLDEEKVFKDGYFSMQKGLSTGSKKIFKGFYSQQDSYSLQENLLNQFHMTHICILRVKKQV